MEPTLITLKLFLDELGIPFKIKTVDDRKKIQKAVYIGQLTGANLGYSFGWYVKGPYSVSLTKDYYKLDNELISDDKEYENYELNKTFKDKLKHIKGILKPPNIEDGIDQEDWLELVASLHYLLKVSIYEKEKASSIIETTKPHIYKYLGLAEKRLREYNFL